MGHGKPFRLFKALGGTLTTSEGIERTRSTSATALVSMGVVNLNWWPCLSTARVHDDFLQQGHVVIMWLELGSIKPRRVVIVYPSMVS